MFVTFEGFVSYNHILQVCALIRLASSVPTSSNLIGIAGRGWGWESGMDWHAVGDGMLRLPRAAKPPEVPGRSRVCMCESASRLQDFHVRKIAGMQDFDVRGGVEPIGNEKR